MALFTAIVLGVATLIFLWIAFKKPSGLPPGKWGLPFIGYVPLNGKFISYQMADLHKKYGDIYVWKMGSVLLMFIHEDSLARKAFNHPDLSERPYSQSLHLSKGSNVLGVILSTGTIWQNNRRFSLRQLRDRGMGKSSLVPAIQEQAQILLETMKENSGKEKVYLDETITATLNVIWKLVADKHFKGDNQNHKDLQKLAAVIGDAVITDVIADMFHNFWYIIPKSLIQNYFSIFKVDEVKEVFDKFFKYADELIEEHRQNLDPEAPKDLIDAYLIDRMETDSNGVHNDDDLKFLLSDLFLAGGDTTSSSLNFFFLYMAAFPDKQKKLQAEIDQVISSGELPTLEDKPRMPYTEAVINEVLRINPIANFILPHVADKDTEMAGYKVPKGTLVFGVPVSIHFDPRYWKEPDRFLPERWLNSEGKFTMKKEGYIPFGSGKRICLGEGMARMELFIFTTAIFQNFSVSPPEGKQIDLLPDYNTLIGHRPRRQEIIFTARL